MIVEDLNIQHESSYMLFLLKAYKREANLKYPDRFHWLYEENPFLPTNFMNVKIIRDHDRIIAQSGAMGIELLVDGSLYPAHWSIDTIVLPEFRGKGYGTALQKENSLQSPFFLSLSMSKKNRRIKENLQAVKLPVLVVLKKILHFKPKDFLSSYLLRYKYRNYLKNIVKLLYYMGFFQILSFGGNILLFIKKHIGKTSEINLNEFNFIPWDEQAFIEWDRLLNDRKEELSFQVYRSSQYLRWRYIHVPNLTYDIYFVRLREQIVGFMVLRKREISEGPGFLLVDYLFLDCNEEVFEIALDFLETKARSEGASQLVVSSSQPKWISYFKENGFKKHREYDGLAITHNPNLHSKILSLGEAHLTIGDHDIDQYQPIDHMIKMNKKIHSTG